MFEKELRIERDFFGRLRLRVVDTPESMFFQLALFFLMILLGLLYCVIIIPAKIIITRPEKLSFWTYFWWLLCFGYISLGMLSDSRPDAMTFFNFAAVPSNILLIRGDYGIWAVIIIAVIFLINILAIINRVGKIFTSNN